MNASDGWDPQQAEQEGWFIWHISVKGPFIGFKHERRLSGYKSGMNASEYDALALAFVQARAAEGSAYHIDALARTQLL